MERVKSIFRRNTERRRPERDEFADGVDGNGNAVEPNGLNIEHTTHDQQREQHSHHLHGRQHSARRHQRDPPVAGDGTAAAATAAPTTSATQTGMLDIELENDTGSSEVYAYITGLAIDRGNALFLLSADGQTPYYPGSPSSTNQPIQQPISINLGPPGTSIHCTIPFLAGARIWFSIGAPLVFAVNPGPGLVEPSIFNQSDPNIRTTFGFAEFTFNNSVIFANISYVDFVGLPISLTLQETSGNIQHVSGLPGNGLQTIADGLRQQTAKDGHRWSSLIVNNNNGQLLRILSPNSGKLLNPSWFTGYWTAYINQVYEKFRNQTLTVNTQAAYGNVSGRNNGGGINFGSGGNFVQPSGRDIFSCSTGPFATGGNAEANVIIPRLAAAFNRSTMLVTDEQPDGAGYKQYYQNPITNHYARIVHAANLDHKGYAFPYDDVTPTNGVPQEGSVYSGSPARLIVAVGGNHAYVRS